MSDISQHLGKVVLIGITHRDHAGNWLRQEQYHGVIKDIGQRQGIVVAVESLSDDFTMPPNVACLQPAPPGEYKEHSTDLVVHNPDYLCLWEVRWPPEGSSANPNWLPGSQLERPGARGAL